MGLTFRKSRSLGPFRLTLTPRGLGVSVGVGPFRLSRGATGRRRASVGAGGVRYTRKVGR